MPETPQDEPPRRRRRAVGPAGALAPGAEPRSDQGDRPAEGAAEDHERLPDEDRLRAERPPHHDRER